MTSFQVLILNLIFLIVVFEGVRVAFTFRSYLRSKNKNDRNDK